MDIDGIAENFNPQLYVLTISALQSMALDVRSTIILPTADIDAQPFDKNEPLVVPHKQPDKPKVHNVLGLSPWKQLLR